MGRTRRIHIGVRDWRRWSRRRRTMRRRVSRRRHSRVPTFRRRSRVTLRPRDHASKDLAVWYARRHRASSRRGLEGRLSSRGRSSGSRRRTGAAMGRTARRGSRASPWGASTRAAGRWRGRDARRRRSRSPRRCSGTRRSSRPRGDGGPQVDRGRGSGDTLLPKTRDGQRVPHDAGRELREPVFLGVTCDQLARLL